MSTADAILVFGAAISGVMAFLASLYFKNSLAWILSTVLWVFNAANGIRLSTETWDSMYFWFFLSLGLAITSVLMILDTRSRAEEEEEELAKGDAELYLESVEPYKKAQQSLAEATAPRVPRRKR